MRNNYNRRNPKCRGGAPSHANRPQDAQLAYPGRIAGDYGPNPYVTDMNKAVLNNEAFRSTLWTGGRLQISLMSIPVGGDVGLEVHNDADQFLRIEEGQGLAMMGSGRDDLYIREHVFSDFAIFVPAGTWHNLVNIGNRPLKVFSVYSPPEHRWGTVHQTQAEAKAAEDRMR